MSGIHLHIIAEGQTEQQFVLKVLAPHLAHYQVYADARCILTSKDKHTGRQSRGGLPNYIKAKNDIQRWLKEDSRKNCRFSTMFDLYAFQFMAINGTDTQLIVAIRNIGNSHGGDITPLV